MKIRCTQYSIFVPRAIAGESGQYRPRAILTSAHLGRNGEHVTVQAAGRSYQGLLWHSPVYPMADHDVALVIGSIFSTNLLNSETLGFLKAAIDKLDMTICGINRHCSALPAKPLEDAFR